MLHPTVEHCLMGIKGTVRRSNDGWFVHCNIDTDVMVWDGDAQDPLLKPPEYQSMIENFCLGTRRLHLYGSPHSLRRGWLTVGTDFTPRDSQHWSDEPIVRAIEGEDDVEWKAVEFEKMEYEARWSSQGSERMINVEEGKREKNELVKVATLLPFVEGERLLRVPIGYCTDPSRLEIDHLRPKSPPLSNGAASSGGLGRGRGAGRKLTIQA